MYVPIVRAPPSGLGFLLHGIRSSPSATLVFLRTRDRSGRKEGVLAKHGIRTRWFQMFGRRPECNARSSLQCVVTMQHAFRHIFVSV